MSSRQTRASKPSEGDSNLDDGLNPRSDPCDRRTIFTGYQINETRKTLVFTTEQACQWLEKKFLNSPIIFSSISSADIYEAWNTSAPLIIRRTLSKVTAGGDTISHFDARPELESRQSVI